MRDWGDKRRVLWAVEGGGGKRGGGEEVIQLVHGRRRQWLVGDR